MHLTVISSAERLALAGAVSLLVLHGAATAVPWLAPALEYRRVLLESEPWRVLTGHWVHLGWPHVLVNAAAWILVARLFCDLLGPARQVVVVLAGSIAVAGGLVLLAPEIAWYRGFSGVLHALFFAGAWAWVVPLLVRRAGRSARVLWLPCALALGGWVKVALEQPGSGALPYADWLGAAVVPQAHAFGAACGTLIGLVLAARVRSGAPAAQAGRERGQREQP